MSTQKKLITLCFATVFTLGLAACGGGGGGGDAPVTGMMDGDGSPEGKYILSGTMIPVEDVPNIVITVDSGEMLRPSPVWEPSSAPAMRAAREQWWTAF